MRFINKIIVAIISILPKGILWIFSKKYIAGETIDDAIVIAKKLNDNGILVTIDLLGEAVTDLSETYSYKDQYLNIIETAEKFKIQGNYSLKPTMFGLQIDKYVCYKNIREIVQKASMYNNFVRIDMEDSSVTDIEIELYQKLLNEFPKNVGLVLQAYLKRTRSDIQSISEWRKEDLPVNFRLCKGIYTEPAEIAFKEYHEINNSFIENLEYLLKNNIYTGIATHDKNLVDEAYKLIEKYKSKAYEFQMLYGVTPELRKQIVDNGHKMRVYIPFGKEWKKYSVRRFKENPKMLKHIIKAMFVKD